ncbi:unnamed protein product [Brachionus calyciflorus]|uniref:MIF4G domain-containing protein n=1 Tax=Brachionus calyciflorus TaxID=104777 RepID=A0A813M6N8_9BILA|nr:unnamed protein product [Brachionus calyciflorus]
MTEPLPETSQTELSQLNQYIQEKEERMKLKTELRSKNFNPEMLRLDDSVLKRLDSSIKKVTSFIKKLKTLTESQKESLTKDMNQLNLSKYLSEVAAAFLEAKLKMNDVQCALMLCSQMHQSYADFSSILFEQWQKVLNIKKDDKIANPSKLRVDLRFFADLISIGVLSEKESLSLLGNQLTILTTCDKEFANISIVSSFCKHCGEDFADLVPFKYDKLSQNYEITIPRSTLYSIDRQKAVKCLFKEYFNSLCKHLLSEHKEVQRIETQNKKIYQTKGELHTEKKEKYEQAITSYRKLIENTESLADLLGEKMPDLPQDDSSKKEDSLINIDVYTPMRGEDFDSNSSPWEDEETRQFYECLPEIKSLIPEILYKDTINVKQETKNQAEQVQNSPVDISIEIEKIEKEIQELENEIPESDVTEPTELIEPEEPEESSQVQEKTISNANIKALMDSFVNQLPNCVNRELIDRAAKDYAMNMNTKVNRKRLIRALFEVQRTRLDLHPFYARFVAILNPIMPDLATDLSNMLLNDFKYQVRKKDQINIESKIKVSRFIGELVKFNMFSKFEALNCLKTLLADFKHHNIEMFCNLLEVCGRYLYRNPETHLKMNLFLEILMRKKQTAVSMDSRYTIMIENAFYYCNPPENNKIEKKALSPLHEYVKKILYKDLNKLCVEKILRLMKKLNWDNEELRFYCINCLIAAWNVRYNSIHCLANLVSGLALYYEEVGFQIVDGVIEDIRLGLEVNLPKFNQRRVSMVKYLGELYNYRMVESSIIFKTLYTLITYGVSYDINEAMSENAIDPLDNYFRVRLVCALLDTCGQYFDRGSTKKKLDCFLVYFQKYYLFKKESSQGVEMARPFDRFDVEFVFTEVLSSLRPEFKFLKKFQDACDAVVKMENEIKESLTKTNPNLFGDFNQGENETTTGLGTINEFEEEEEELDEEEEEYRNENKEEDGEDDLSEKHDEDYERGLTSSGSDLDDSKIKIHQSKKETLSKEDEEFMQAFDSLVTENIAQRTKETNRMPTVDISVPMLARKVKPNQPMELTGLTTKRAENDDEKESKKQSFNFVLMLKKGNKTQYQNMEVPVTSEFASQFKAREESEKVEKEKLKQLTLNINERMEQEEFQEMFQQTGQFKSVNVTMSGNTNRDRFKYNHPKGAPDADLIFGSSSQRNQRGFSNK